MFNNSRHLATVSGAIALYISGAFVGAMGAYMTVIIGMIAIFSGAPLVTTIMVTAGISALGLTIADIGRKKLHSSLPLTHGNIATTMIKHAG